MLNEAQTLMLIDLNHISEDEARVTGSQGPTLVTESSGLRGHVDLNCWSVARFSTGRVGMNKKKMPGGHIWFFPLSLSLSLEEGREFGWIKSLSLSLSPVRLLSFYDHSFSFSSSSLLSGSQLFLRWWTRKQLPMGRRDTIGNVRKEEEDLSSVKRPMSDWWALLFLSLLLLCFHAWRLVRREQKRRGWIRACHVVGMATANSFFVPTAAAAFFSSSILCRFIHSLSHKRLYDPHPAPNSRWCEFPPQAIGSAPNSSTLFIFICL